jgi:hypothetical protein
LHLKINAMLTETQLESLRFPVGRWQKPEVATVGDWEANQAILTAFPARLRAQLAAVTDVQLDTAYRPDGWTVRQVVHHCADSHMNCLIRLKLSLTEDKPTIKPYAEQLWAELPDYILPIESSLRLLDSLHARIAYLLTHITPAQRAREYIHPQYQSTYRIDEVVSLYAWHCRHHMGHIALVVDAPR